MTRLEALSHDEAIELLPWLVNGSLDAEERHAVGAHASDCVICRRELAELTALDAAIRSSAADAPAADMRRINARIDARLERQTIRARIIAAIRNSLRSPWRIAFAVQTVALVVVATLFLQSQRGAPEFTTLTTPATLPPGHYLRVVFDPTIESTAVSSLLGEFELRAVAGPSERGVYTLQFAESTGSGEREAAIAALRNDNRVLFAQPVRGGDGQ